MIADLTLQFLPLVPNWLLVLLGGALLVAILLATFGLLQKGVPVKWVATLGLLRLGAWLLFTLILLQPVLSSTRQARKLPELAILIDASASMGQPGGGDGSRLDEARTPLQQGAFAEALQQRFQLHWFTFAGSAVRREPGQLKDLPADGTTTDFAQSVADAFHLLEATDQPPERLLLVSDGHDHGAADVVELAQKLGITIDVLAPTAKPRTAAPLVAIANVQAARRVLLGSETHFAVTLQASPPLSQDQPLLLHLSEEGKEIQQLPVTLKANQWEQVVVLAHRPTTTGTKTYQFQLHVPGEPAVVAELQPPLQVQVVDSKYEILVLEDSWRWEYKYLQRLFEDDPSFRFTALVSRGSGAFVQFGSPDRRDNHVGFPQNRADLEGYDLFFLGDVDVARWTPELRAALVQLVTEQGKSLVVIAGPKLANLLDIPELHALLPVELSRDSGKPIAGDLEVRPGAEAAASPFFFQLDNAAVLPPLDFVYPALRKRPAATVLLQTVKQRNDYGPLIVLAEQTVGRGRVLFVGTDTLWKWQTLAEKDGPTPYSIFWQQAMRALTPQRSQLGAAQIWLTLAHSSGTVGRRLEIEAEIDSDRSIPGSKLVGTVSSPSGRAQLTFNVDPAQPRRYHAELTPKAPGLHQIQVALSAEGKTVAEGAVSFQVDQPASEATEIGIDHANLQRIAQATGGRWIDPANPATWPTPDLDSNETVPQLRTFDLWNSFTLLLLLCALLGADWFVRVIKGLV
jgi:hypothetical protein